MTTVESLATYRLTKMRERVERLERALIKDRAELMAGFPPHHSANADHFYTLAENELVREGLVRPKNIREMER